jgi:hypothetical protein
MRVLICGQQYDLYHYPKCIALKSYLVQLLGTYQQYTVDERFHSIKPPALLHNYSAISWHAELLTTTGCGFGAPIRSGVVA